MKNNEKTITDIDLFVVSFEVKSESDNLSGKKLLCERLVETLQSGLHTLKL